MTGVVERYKNLNVSVDGMDFEGGKLTKINGARPEYMSGQKLIEMVRQVAFRCLMARMEAAELRQEIERMHSEAGWKASYDHAERSGGTL